MDEDQTQTAADAAVDVNAGATKTEAKTEAKTAETAKAPPVAEQRLTMTLAEYQANQDRIRELEAYKAADADRAEKQEAARLKTLAEKEGSDKALQAQREQLKAKEKEWADKYNSLQKAIGDEKIDAAISKAMEGITFIGKTPETRAAAAADFRTLVKASAGLTATQDAAGAWLIRDQSGRDASDALAEIVKAKSYLIASDTQGGAGGGGSADAGRQGSNVDESNPYVKHFREFQATNRNRAAGNAFIPAFNN